MSKKRFRPQICLILQQSCCLYSKSCCWIIRSCRYFSKVVSELSVFLTSWILARGDPFLKAHFQFGAELQITIGFSHKLNSCAWRSVFESAFSIWSGTLIASGWRNFPYKKVKGRLGVPPGGAEQGNTSRRRGMVPGRYSYNLQRRLFLAVFQTADQSRETRPGTGQRRKKYSPSISKNWGRVLPND